MKSPTKSNLLAWLFLMNCMMFPWAIHSETVENCPFSMFP